MPIPPLPACIVERDAQHAKVVDRLLAESNVRVALLGMGGIGKTTLACSIARDPKVLNAYPRRLFVSFEGASTPDLAFTSLANIFQIPTTNRNSHSEILSQLIDYLTAEKTLLIIDNFETFWEVSANRRDADQLLGQLASLANLAIIVTMRGNQRPGNISWMKMDPLQTLSEDASRGLLSSITHGTHNQSASDEECINKLLDAVAGIPLAVTLIGTLLRDESETAQSLWRRWCKESTRAISTDSDMDDRLYRLDVSLRLTVFGPRMKDSTRDVLAAVSLLPTGLSLDEDWLDDLQSRLPDTAAVNIPDCIRILRNVALTVSNPPHPSSGINRLRILPPVRDFCAQNLSLDNQVIRRLADLYHTKVWSIDAGFHIKERYDWFTEEISNIASVLKHSLDIKYVTDQLGYASAVYTRWLDFLEIASTDILECAVEAFAENLVVKAECLQAWGQVLQRREQTTKAIEKIEQALFIHREIDSTVDVAWDLTYLGKIHHCMEQVDAAERHLNEAVNLFAKISNNTGKIFALYELSNVLYDQGKISEAESNATQSLKLSRAEGDQLKEANALHTLGLIHRRQGQRDVAVETLTTCRDLCKDIRYTIVQAYATETLAYVVWDTGELDKAALHLREAISLYEKANWQSFGEADIARANLKRLEEYIAPRRDSV